MKLRIKLSVLISLFTISSIYSQPFVYPKARKTNQTDNYFGTSVNDPYRWLEDDRSKETEYWVKSENEVTEKYLAQIPFRDSLKSRMQALWNSPKYFAPFACGKNYFYYRYTGIENQPELFYMKGIDYVPMMYFDPNKLSADGTTAITQTVPSHDGSSIAFMVSDAGSDWNEIRIKEVKNMKTYPEKIGWVKFSSIAWWKDGFFYSRYDSVATGNIFTQKNEYHKVYYHKLNTPQSSDSLVFEDKKNSLMTFGASVTDDEHYLIISGTVSTTGNNIYIQDLRNPNAKLIPVVKSFDNDYELVGTIGDKLLFFTNYKSPRKKLILIDTKAPQFANWKDFVPQQEYIMQGATMGFDKVIVHYMKDASSHLVIYNKTGVMINEVPLAGFGTVDAINGSLLDTIAFISYTTFTSPGIIYRYDLKHARLYTQFKPKLNYNPEDYVTEQVFYTSKDGTKIPLFLVHKKDYKPDGNTPTLLYGYGGFNISKTPEFKMERMVFLEHGGLFAQANIRGGGEYGTEWHEAGTKLKKQNVFDDFIAAAEYLIKQNYTNPSKLAVSGRSNGGLLIGAVMTQRPELFKVALPAVGVMDMLRYHKFTIGWSWKSDYGTSDDSLEFNAIYKYSPLQNIKEGVQYPATLITTADHDDRVVPAHSFKFAATLQEKQKGNNPVMIRIDSNAGHGSGKPTGKLIDEQSDIFSFLFYNLGMTL